MKKNRERERKKRKRHEYKSKIIKKKIKLIIIRHSQKKVKRNVKIIIVDYLFFHIIYVFNLIVATK
jgi:hypothetical protein